jgi:hypothetical protein
MLTSEHLRPGHLLRDFPLPDGRMLSDARGPRALLLLVGSERELAPLTRELAGRRQEFEAEHAALTQIEDAAALDAQNGAPLAVPSAVITDRFGEIIHVWQGALPHAEAVIRMLQYVTIRCEECFPPEWPPL